MTKVTLAVVGCCAFFAIAVLKIYQGSFDQHDLAKFSGRVVFANLKEARPIYLSVGPFAQRNHIDGKSRQSKAIYTGDVRVTAYVGSAVSVFRYRRVEVETRPGLMIIRGFP